MSKKVFLISLLFLFVVGCSSSGGSEEVVQGPLPQVFVFPGPQEELLISQEVIDLPNCTGNAETSQSVTRSHTVLYTLELGQEITVSADGRAGIPGIGEVGVGAAVATNYQVGYGRSETVSRSQTVAAAPGSHMQHTIQQFEVWETGEVLIVAGEINQRLPYSFRRDFSIKAVAPANVGCTGGTSDSQPTEAVATVVGVTHPVLIFQTVEPPGTSMMITVNEGEIHAMTAGPICVASVCLPGGPDRGSVVIFLPSATYEVTGLNPPFNWHGAFYANLSQWEIIADRLVSEQKIPGTCIVEDGCSIVDVVVVGPQGIVNQYQE